MLANGDPNLMAGFEHRDEAAVLRINAETALGSRADFTPG